MLVNIYISSSKVINNRGEMNYRSTRGFERFELLILVILKGVLNDISNHEERSFYLEVAATRESDDNLRWDACSSSSITT